MKTTIIINPVAGKRNYRNIKKAINVLRSKDIIPNIKETTKRGDAYIFAKEEIKKGTEIVIAAGGDGTINEIANGLIGSTAKLGILPIGVANVFSLELQIPSDPILAADVVLNGLPTLINAGYIRLNKESGEGEVRKYFMLMVGIGFDGGVVREIDRIKISKCGKAAYIFTGMKVISKYTRSLLHIKIDQERMVEGYSAVVGKAHYYGGRFSVTPHASLMDDSLALCVFKSKGSLKMLKYVFGILTMKHLTYTDVYYCKAKEIEVNSEDEVFVQADGDLFGRLPAYLSVEKDALTVLLPKNN